MTRMKRREFITLRGGAAAAWSLAASAQQEKLPRSAASRPSQTRTSRAFSQGLREAGYVDGQNILLKTRFHRGVLDRINEFAGELVARITAQPAALSP